MTNDEAREAIADYLRREGWAVHHQKYLHCYHARRGDTPDRRYVLGEHGWRLEGRTRQADGSWSGWQHIAHGDLVQQAMFLGLVPGRLAHMA